MSPLAETSLLIALVIPLGVLYRRVARAARSGEICRQLQQKVRYHSVPGLAWRLVVRCVRPVGRLDIVALYEKDLSEPIPDIRARTALTIEPCLDVDQLTPLTAWEESGDERRRAVAQSISERLKRGHIGFVARERGKVVHCTWLSIGWQETLAGRFVVIPHDVAYFGGSYTAKHKRGLAIHTEVNAAMLRFVRQRGYRTALAYIDFDNASSRKTYNLMNWSKRGAFLAFKPSRSNRTHIWRLQGRTDPFVEERIPSA
jgi:hypothetical protein